MSYRPEAQGLIAELPEPAHGRWITVVVLVLSAVTALLLWPTIASLMIEWRDTDNLTYTHGYLIVGLCAWLLIRAGQASTLGEAAGQPVRPDWRFIPLLVVLSLCWLIACRAGIELLHQVLLPMLGFAAVCGTVGIGRARSYWFAFAYLYFAIPVWSMGNEVLQAISVVAVRLLLLLTSVPAYVTGNVVHIPAGAFEIAGGCSGLHFFIVGLAVAALFGEVHRDGWRVRLKLLVLAAVLAMVSNWVRIYTIVVAGHLTNMQHYLVRVDHYYFGWGLFAVTLLVFFWLANRIPATSPSRDVSEQRPSSALLPSTSWRGLVLGGALSLAGVAVGPVLATIAPVRAAEFPQTLLPSVAGSWSLVNGDSQGSFWHPSYAGSDAQQMGIYRHGPDEAAAFVAVYLEQWQGKELIGFGNSLMNGLGNVLADDTIETPGGIARRLRTAGAAGRSVVLYYYGIGAKRAVRPFVAQLKYGVTSLFTATPSRVVAVKARCGADCDAAEASARQLLTELDSAWAIPGSM